MSRPLLSIYMLTAVIGMIGNASAYLTQILLARYLSPADFGASNAALALAVLVNAPVVAMPMAVARMIIECERGLPLLIQRIIIATTIFGALIYLFYMPFAPIAQTALQLSPIASWLLLPLLIVSMFLAQVPLGLWQGTSHYVSLTLATAAIPILRCGAVILFVGLAGGALHSALWSLISGGMIVWLAGLYIQRHQFLSPQSPGTPQPALSSVRQLLHDFWPVCVATCGLALPFVDQLLVRALASPDDSGQYAAASTLARIALILPGSLVGVVFPETARIAREGGNTRASLQVLGTALAVTAATSFSAAIAMMAFPNLFVQLLAGNAYNSAAPILQILAPAMGLAAVISVIVIYAMARRQMAIIWLNFSALPLFCGLVFGLRPQAMEIAWLLLIFMAALTAICCGWLFISHRTKLDLGSKPKAAPPG